MSTKSENCEWGAAYVIERGVWHLHPNSGNFPPVVRRSTFKYQDGLMILTLDVMTEMPSQDRKMKYGTLKLAMHDYGDTLEFVGFVSDDEQTIGYSDKSAPKESLAFSKMTICP